MTGNRLHGGPDRATLRSVSGEGSVRPGRSILRTVRLYGTGRLVIRCEGPHPKHRILSPTPLFPGSDLVHSGVSIR